MKTDGCGTRRMFAVPGPLLLGLTAIGIYAVVSCAVARRTREIGVRLAFGATSGRVVVQIIPENLRSGTSGRGGTKKRGARQPHKRLQYCVNVNRTSPDHLLLGRNADIDKSVECSEYSAGLGKSQNKCSLTWCLTRGFACRGLDSSRQSKNSLLP